MEKSERVLKALSDHSQSSDYKYERLYRYLFSEEMFAVAYQRIYAKQGNMTPGTDGQDHRWDESWKDWKIDWCP